MLSALLLSASPWSVLPCAVLLSLSAGCRCLLCRTLMLGLAPRGLVPSGAVFSCACLRFVLRAVWFAVVCWRVLLLAAVFCALCVLGCRVVPALPSPSCAVLCRAVVIWRACVVLFKWSLLFLAPGALVRSCVPSCFFWCSVVWYCAALLGAWCAVLLRARRVLLRPVLLCCRASCALLCWAVLAPLCCAPVLCAVASAVLGGAL